MANDRGKTTVGTLGRTLNRHGDSRVLVVVVIVVVVGAQTSSDDYKKNATSVRPSVGRFPLTSHVTLQPKSTCSHPAVLLSSAENNTS